ncbi:hypothetical protein REPUB_Repub18cG0063900 [Reevesia pubescens]
MAASSIPLHHFSGCFTCPHREREYNHSHSDGYGHGRSPLPRARFPLRPISASVESPPFPIFQPPQLQQSPSQIEPADPDFYKIGYVRSMRAYGIEFKEGPDGFGVYASKDVEPLRRARLCFYPSTLLFLSHSSQFR